MCKSQELLEIFGATVAICDAPSDQPNHLELHRLSAEIPSAFRRPLGRWGPLWESGYAHSTVFSTAARCRRDSGHERPGAYWNGFPFGNHGAPIPRARFRLLLAIRTVWSA